MKGKTDILQWLQNWVYSNYKKNQTIQVIINTIDNPGWGITININHDFSKKTLPLVDIEKNENDWFYCSIKNKKFEGDGGLFNLKDILHVFKNTISDDHKKYPMNDNLTWLLQWFANQCNDDWEHSNGIKIGTLVKPGWYISISLKDTECEGTHFEAMAIERSEKDWLNCFIKNEKFEGLCGPFNLLEVLQTFQQWAKNCRQ